MKEDIKVFISGRDSTCDECGEHLGKQAWITLNREKGALCLSCGDLAQLEFLPSGDAALTRRSKKYSTLWAVVLQWSKSRKRYERQGLLVEEKALAQAEEECLADAEARARRREREAERRALRDEAYLQQFAAKIRELFPGCPPDRGQIIASHACMKYSGRVGRTSAAKQLDEKAVQLAVIAHIRHTETDYDALLGIGVERGEARAMVSARVNEVLAAWREGA